MSFKDSFETERWKNNTCFPLEIKAEPFHIECCKSNPSISHQSFSSTTFLTCVDIQRAFFYPFIKKNMPKSVCRFNH